MLYTVLLGDICCRNGIEFQLYADDTHVYMTFKPSVPMAKEESIGPDKVVPIEHVRNLGYIMDKFLKNGPHINKLTSICYCMLWDIANIRSNMDKRTAQLITQALVLSHIDYCNSVLAGTTKY